MAPYCPTLLNAYNLNKYNHSPTWPTWPTLGINAILAKFVVTMKAWKGSGGITLSRTYDGLWEICRHKIWLRTMS